MEEKQVIKEKIMKLFDIENRSMNIREITNLLKQDFQIERSQPSIKNYLEELIREGKLEL